MNIESGATKLSRLRLDSMPLPAIDESGDKEHRGVVLAIGGSTSIPGAIMLTGLGALRAGAGKLQIATAKGLAATMGVAIPEAMVMSLVTSRRGEISASGDALLHSKIQRASAVVVGPGMADQPLVQQVLQEVIEYLGDSTTLVLDGAAVTALAADETMLHELHGKVVITPHAGEMAALLEIPREEVLADPGSVAQHCADRFQAVVVLKGGETFIASQQPELLCYRDGKAGLGTSGSGDVLAGVIAGLAARGADARTAAAWGVWTHGSAGNKLSRSVGRIGFLARELLPEIPALLT